MNVELVVIIFIMTSVSIVLCIPLKNNNAVIVLLLPLFYISTAIYTLLMVVFFEFGRDVPFFFYDAVSDVYIYKSIIYFLLATLAYLFGANIYRYLVFITNIDMSSNLKCIKFKTNFYIGDATIKIVSKISDTILFFIALLAPIILVSAVGYSDFLFRVGYELDANRTLMILFLLICPISSISTALIKNQFFRYVSLCILILSLFSISSRTVAIPFIFYFSRWFIFGFKKPKIYRVAIFCFTCLILTCLSLQLRNFYYQGLIGNTLSLIKEGVDVEYIFLGINYIFSFSTSVLSFSIEHASYIDDAFYTALNPLLSSMINMESRRYASLNEFVPMSAIAELAMMGEVYVWCYYAAVGFTFSSCLAFFKKENFYFYLLTIVFCCLFFIMSTQYNLRGVTRFIYYMLIFRFLIYPLYNTVKGVFRNV